MANSRRKFRGRTIDVNKVGGTRNECGLLAFSNRTSARRIARVTPGHVRPQRCDDCGLWHNRVVPVDVRRGMMTRLQWLAAADG